MSLCFPFYLCLHHDPPVFVRFRLTEKAIYQVVNHEARTIRESGCKNVRVDNNGCEPSNDKAIELLKLKQMLRLKI
jgi:hypothetical protein